MTTLGSEARQGDTATRHGDKNYQIIRVNESKLIKNKDQKENEIALPSSK